MRIIHGLITMIAALAVIAFSGSWIAEKFDIHRGLGIIAEPATSVDPYTAYREAKGISVKDTAKLAVAISAHPWRREFWKDSAKRTIIEPVYAGELGMYLTGMSSSYRGSAFVRDSGNCHSKIVNLIQIDSETNEGIPLYAKRIFIPSFAHFENEENKLVLAMVIENDTNGDDHLSCGDVAHLDIHNLVDGDVNRLPRSFNMTDMTGIEFDVEAGQFAFVERKIEETSIRLTTTTMTVEGEIISVVEAPDLLSRAKAAFENTSP